MTQNKLMDTSINATNFSCFNSFYALAICNLTTKEPGKRQQTIKHKLCLELSIENFICARPINNHNQIVAFLHFCVSGKCNKVSRLMLRAFSYGKMCVSEIKVCVKVSNVQRLKGSLILWVCMITL